MEMLLHSNQSRAGIKTINTIHLHYLIDDGSVRKDSTCIRDASEDKIRKVIVTPSQTPILGNGIPACLVRTSLGVRIPLLDFKFIKSYRVTFNLFLYGI